MYGAVGGLSTGLALRLALRNTRSGICVTPGFTGHSHRQEPTIPESRSGRAGTTQRLKRPGGITILATLQIIVGVGSASWGVLLLLSGLGMAVSADVPLIGAFGAVGGVIAASVGVFGLFLGIGLLRLRNWARVSVIVLCSLSFISLALSLRVVSAYPQALVGPLVGCTIATIIIVYLRSKGVRAAFGT